MRKVLSLTALLMAAVMLMMCFAACGDDKKDDSSSSEPEETLAGTYKLVDVTGDGAEGLLMLKDYVTLTVNDDNSGELKVEYGGQSQAQDVKFDPDNNTCEIVGTGGTATYTFDGKKLSITVDKSKQTQVYEKQ